MTVGLVDTTVLIHLFRNEPAALAWSGAQTAQLAVTTISWLEFFVGAGSKAAQTRCTAILSQFALLPLTDADQAWAMQQLARYRLSHGIGMHDCLIAAVAQRLQTPLYTHNLKHMQTLVTTLAHKPY